MDTLTDIALLLTIPGQPRIVMVTVTDMDTLTEVALLLSIPTTKDCHCYCDCHQLALITSLPFVHTARRYYRLTGLARTSDWGPGGRQRSAGILQEAVPTWSVRGSKSRNKVSVGEPAEGSLLFPFRLFAFHLLTSVSERLCAPSGCARWYVLGVGRAQSFSLLFWSCLSV